MTNQPAPGSRERELDEALAAFSDQVMRDATKAETSMSTDAELHVLEEMVVRVHRAVGHAEPSAALARRIRNTLEAEWHRGGMAAQSDPWWRGLLAGLSRPQLAAVAALAVIVLAVIALPLVSPDSNLPGAAGGAGTLVPVLVVLAVAVVAVAWWVNRRKR